MHSQQDKENFLVHYTGGQIWWSISEKGRSQIRRKGLSKRSKYASTKDPPLVLKPQGVVINTIDKCFQYLCRSMNTIAVNHEPLSVLLLGLLEKQASRFTFTVSVPFHFSFMYQPGGEIFYNLDVQTSQILRSYFIENVLFVFAEIRSLYYYPL